MQARPEPEDLTEFWTGLKRTADAVDAKPRRRPTWRRRVKRVTFSSVGGRRLGAWLVRPASGEPTAAVVVGHGYGGRAGPELQGIPDGAAAFFPVCRGLPSLSLQDDLPRLAAGHVLHGIESKETYVIGGCAADIWLAATALEELLGSKLGHRAGGLPLGYMGGSFGGGIGALAVPWDERFDAVALHVPTFGSNTDRLEVPSVGSSEALRNHVQHHPEAWEVLDYFDAVHGARRLRVPTVVAPAHRDPAVPPVGQWAVAEAVPEEFRSIVELTAGHEEYPEAAAEMAVFYSAAKHLFSSIGQGADR